MYTCSDENCLDPMSIYAELAKDVDFKITTRTVSAQPEYDEDTEVDMDEPSSSTVSKKARRLHPISSTIIQISQPTEIIVVDPIS